MQKHVLICQWVILPILFFDHHLSSDCLIRCYLSLLLHLSFIIITIATPPTGVVYQWLWRSLDVCGCSSAIDVVFRFVLRHLTCVTRCYPGWWGWRWRWSRWWWVVRWWSGHCWRRVVVLRWALVLVRIVDTGRVRVLDTGRVRILDTGRVRVWNERILNKSRI